MLKRGPNKLSKGVIQPALNPLSNRNNNGNESFSLSMAPQYYSATPEYTIELKTNLKPPAKLTTIKKTPEVQISIGSPKENIEVLRPQNENSPVVLSRKKSSNKIKPTSPILSYCRELKSVKAPEKSVPSVSKEYNSNNDDLELAQRIAKLQNELHKFGIFEPRSPSSAANHIQNFKYASFVEIITQLKEVVDKLQLRDISQKQEISNLRRTNDKLKNHLVIMEQKLKAQKDRRDAGFLSPTRLDSRILSSKRNSRDVKLTLEEKAHSFAKSVLSSPSHKTFDLCDYKGRLLEAEMSTERRAKNDKINKSNSLSTAKLPQGIVNSSTVSISNLTLETKSRDFDPKQTTEIDSLVHIKTVTMSEVDHLGGATLSTNHPASHNSLSIYESQNIIKESKTSTLLDPLQSLSRRDRSLADRKVSPEPAAPQQLRLMHQKSQGSSSAISFPKTSFVPSKVRRDELRIRVNDKGLGSRSLSQSRYERHRDSDFLSGTFSPTASKVMKQYRHYLNEPHISPLQSESKSINMDFGGQYLNNTSKNGDDTRNLSVNNLNSPNRKGSTQAFLVEEMSKSVIPEEFSLEDFQNKQTPEEEKVTLFNRCLKLTMGLSSSVLDENQYKRDGEKKTLTPPRTMSSPSVASVKRPYGFGAAIRK